MSDDFGTINLKRGERAREIEVLRQHYRQHRDALARMIADAPTEHLATEYQRLVGEIDRALAKLHELEGGATAPPPIVDVPPPPHRPTDPGMRPLAQDTLYDELAEPPAIPVSEAEPRSRVPLILGAAILALAIIGWLIWRASSERTAGTAIVEETATATSDTSGTDTVEAGTSTSDSTIEPAAAVPAGLAVIPVSHDYGTIRKGTRATRQYELSNTTDEPMTISVARSACRCLYYEHAPVIPPKAKENLTVTIDGARAKAGTLHEQIRVASKANAAVGVTIDVNATIQ
jgi:hypothetical protein